MLITEEPRRIAALIAFTICLSFSAVAAADNPRLPSSISVEERAKAADAYDQGTSAYLTEHYESAAHWFERAYRLVPTSTALLQAVRAHYHAGNSIRAANLALQLRDAYPDDARSKQVAEAVIASVKARDFLVETSCDEECTLELDGALIEHPSFFVTPNVEHSLKAAFAHGETSTLVQGEAGDIAKVELASPVPPPAPPVPRWAFFSSLGVTAVMGALTLWSGVNAKSGVSAYESAARTSNSPGINHGGSSTPEQQATSLLDEGREKERRTNILIGVTAGMAAATAVLGAFTDWKGESRDPAAARRIEPSVGFGRKGGSLMIKGHF